MSKSRVPDAIKRQVVKRARARCEYCQSPEAYSNSSLCIEHIMPCSRGGSSGLSNLALACRSCNESKADLLVFIDPLNGTSTRLFHPREDAWDSHFEWSEDQLHVVATTGVGRATVAALKLNRPGLINQRQVLLAIGKHPPTDD